MMPGAYMSEVDKFIQKECALGGMLGPFQTRPFIPWTQISPLMSRPKKDNDTSRRIIIDLSYPEQRSVNAGIPKNFYQDHGGLHIWSNLTNRRQ